MAPLARTMKVPLVITKALPVSSNTSSNSNQQQMQNTARLACGHCGYGTSPFPLPSLRLLTCYSPREEELPRYAPREGRGWPLRQRQPRYRRPRPQFRLHPPYRGGYPGFSTDTGHLSAEVTSRVPVDHGASGNFGEEAFIRAHTVEIN